MAKRTMIRQGDVLLIPLSKAEYANLQTGGLRDAGASRNREDGAVLAFGEVTGHAHVAKKPQDGNVKLQIGNRNRQDGWRMVRESVEVLDVSKPTSIVHEEHAELDLPAGAWEVRHQREYDPRDRVTQSAWVRD